MEELIKLLENPFDDVTTKEAFQTKCEEIATKLFNDYCINCNGKKFYFAEIEFYYWQKEKWKEKWNKVTYARDGYNGGDLFFHLSGIDICFESTFDKNNDFKNPHFGGILIRSIIEKHNNVTSGPWNVMMKILNTCKGGMMPYLEKIQSEAKCKSNIQSTFRQLGEVDMVEEENNPLHLCFFDKAIPKDNWNFNKETFNKEKGIAESSKMYYNKSRFNYDN